MKTSWEEELHNKTIHTEPNYILKVEQVSKRKPAKQVYWSLMGCRASALLVTKWKLVTRCYDSSDPPRPWHLFKCQRGSLSSRATISQRASLTRLLCRSASSPPPCCYLCLAELSEHASETMWAWDRAQVRTSHRPEINSQPRGKQVKNISNWLTYSAFVFPSRKKKSYVWPIAL